MMEKRKLGSLLSLLLLLLGGHMFAFAAGVDVKSPDKRPRHADLLQDLKSFSSVELTTLPDKTTEAIRIYPGAAETDASFHVYKTYPNRTLEIYKRNEPAGIERLTLPNDWRRDVTPLLITERNGRLILAVHDAKRTIPSRTLGPLVIGIDLYEVSGRTGYQPKILAEALQVGGLNTQIYGRIFDRHVVICGENSCFAIGDGGDVTAWDQAGMKSHEFVEVLITAPDMAYAILRPKYDERVEGVIGDPAVASRYARYSLARLTPSEVTHTEISHGLGVPYRLHIDRGGVQYDVAHSADSLRRVLFYDLGRMLHDGILEFGSNNLEGRIAWSQTYYLNALLLIAAENQLLGPLVDNEMRNAVRPRVKRELDLLARIGATDYPNYKSKRYSLDREPLLFAIHLGRVARTLGLARQFGFDSPAVDAASASIAQALWSLDGTVEEMGSAEEKGRRFSALRYKPGLPFWADGVVTPYNYISAYIHGLLRGPTVTDIIVKRAADLCQAVLVLEEIAHNKLWRYWWADGFHGWTWQTGRSHNTPESPGRKSVASAADITYRTLDALAIVALKQHAGTSVPDAVLENIRGMVRDGWLLPFVNEELSMLGAPAALKPAVAYRYARSATSWELESQLWALLELSRRSLPTAEPDRAK